MLNLPENTNSYLLFFLPFILILYFIMNYRPLKMAELNKLNFLYSEIEKEKQIALKLKSAPNEIEFIKKKTHKKLQIIKVDILNINYTLSEIV